jgi:exonuclease III
MNVNEFNAPIKRHRVTNLVKKQDPIICFILLEKNKHWLSVKGWKKVFQESGPHKQAGVAILISDKVNFILKSIRRDNEGHLLLVKGTIHQEEISILNIYSPNTGAFI